MKNESRTFQVAASQPQDVIVTVTRLGDTLYKGFVSVDGERVAGVDPKLSKQTGVFQVDSDDQHALALALGFKDGTVSRFRMTDQQHERLSSFLVYRYTCLGSGEKYTAKEVEKYGGTISGGYVQL